MLFVAGLPKPLRILAATVAMCAVASKAAHGQAAADSASAPAIDAGRAIFHGQGNCQLCHGANLEGGPIAPTLMAHPWKDAKGGGYIAILNVVSTGAPGTVMVSHPGGISDEDARRVAAYVWAVSHGKARP